MFKVVTSFLGLFILLNSSFASPGMTTQGDRLVGSVGVEDHVIFGELASVAAIGGESTGIAVENESELIEVSFGSEVENVASFIDSGTRFILRGYYSEVNGVEIPVRKVFFVTSYFIDEPVGICGQGGPLMLNIATGHCVQSLTTCQTARLSFMGYVPANGNNRCQN